MWVGVFMVWVPRAQELRVEQEYLKHIQETYAEGLLSRDLRAPDSRYGV